MFFFFFSRARRSSLVSGEGGSAVGCTREEAASSSTFTFCTDDVILCMRDFSCFRVSASVSAGLSPCCFSGSAATSKGGGGGETCLRYPVTFDLSCLSQRLTKKNKTKKKAFYRQENVELCTIRFVLMITRLLLIF